MSSEEYIGTFYVWAPPSLQGWLGHRLHFSASDLQRGGRLQRLNDDPSSPLSIEDSAWEDAGKPDRTITFYRRARALRWQLTQQLTATGESLERSLVRADAMLQSQAISMIKEKPLAHLALIVPFLWRGAARTLPLLILVLIIGLMRSRHQLIVFMLPALTIVLIYGICITFFPRYGGPSYELSILAALVAAKELWVGARGWLRARGRADCYLYT